MKVEVGNTATNGFKNGGARFVLFLRRQAGEIRKGGLPVLLRKVGTLLAIVPSLLLVLLVRALRPVIWIRFGQLESNRIGHFAVNTELYLCRRDSGVDKRHTLDIFYHNAAVSNWQLVKMWNRTLHVSDFARRMDRLSRRVPGYEKHLIPMPSDRDVQGLLRRTRVHLSFTPDEERLGRAAVPELGIPERSPFVCFHARDSAYLDAVLPDVTNWRYHDYRDCTIQNYVPAAEELAHRGYFVVRMGAVVKERLATSNVRIIDYASNGRTDFLDIYLGAKCQFFICDTAGLYAIPFIFRRPIAYVNIVPLEHAPSYSAGDVFIAKKLWLRKERRFMKFKEILESGAGKIVRSEQYGQRGIEVIANTPDEITALVIEMDERLKGTWQTTEEDEDLQQRFWSLFRQSELHGVILSRIGADFLRRNRDLLV